MNRVILAPCAICGKPHHGPRKRCRVYQAPPGEELWTMQDGTQIAVGMMDERHVRNALRLVIRKTREAQQQAAFDQLSDLADDYDRSQEDARDAYIASSGRDEWGDA